jgi:ribosomal protein S18
MKVSGVTFIRNAVRFDYPVLESIRSLLPLVDELIIVLGRSEDTTESLLKSIDNPKVKIVDSVWDDTVKEGGRVLALETNKGIEQVAADSDWIFYLQADEILHEKDYSEIRKEMQSNVLNQRVEGLLFSYIHFYGHYSYIGDSRRWYQNEVRIIRNLKGLTSYKDAQGFRLNNRKLKVKKINAEIYHYGWVKNPKYQMEKQKHFNLLWHSEEEVKKMVQEANEYDYSNIDSLSLFVGSHPKVMETRIKNANWDFYFDPVRKKIKIKEQILFVFEQLLKRPLFRYKNYDLL